jgi:CSLREA domain-containing protein
MRRLGFVFVLVLALSAGAPFVAAASAATTFHVNSVDDPGTGACDVTECTLREAIAAANADATADTIEFSAVPSGSGDIFLLTDPLPAVSNPVLIDGTTHPDFAEGFPGVRIDGSALASGAGLRLSGGAITVKGVAIDGFSGNGITIDTAGGNVLQGNVIGQTVPVTGAGISIASGGNTIGGTVAGDGNTIYAGGDGVAVLSGTGNQIRGNTFGVVGGLSIDLADDGRTANDALDADTGPNNRQNFPSLTSMSTGLGSVTFAGTLSSAANTQYTLDFYAAGGCGGGDSEYVGTALVTTNGSGSASFNPTFVASPAGTHGVATATDPAGNTSELSDAVVEDPNAVPGITATCSPLAIAQAMAVDPSTVTGASYVALPPLGSPNAIGTGSFAGFPTNGGSYGVLSSGSAARLAPGQPSGEDISGGNVRGDTDFDVTVLKVDLAIPVGANCLTLDFRFLSDEYPVYVNSDFNDAFIAELDSSTWDTAGSAITAPNNFAFDPSHEVISINSTGNTAMTHAATAGTGYDGGDGVQGGATPLLHASKVVTSGAHSLYLSIFDQGDHALDSGVELDNLRFSTRDPAACAEGATSDETPPVLTLITPADDSTTNDTTPTYSGAAGTAVGDLDTITVKIYAGTTATGSPLQTITTTKTGGTWTVDGTTPLAPGTYTAQAQQSDQAGNTGFSTANTFTVTNLPLISVNDVSVNPEGNAGSKNATFTITRSGDSSGSSSVHYATSPGTATAGTDYTTLGDTTVTFDAGQTTKTVDVVVLGDTLDENDETFTLQLSGATGAAITDASGTGTIVDDDAPPAVSISDQTVTEGNSGTTSMTFTVSLSAASGRQVSIAYATADGSATAPSDYGAASGTLSFEPGQTSKTFVVGVVGDTAVEPDETLGVTLSAPSNVTIGDGSATGTIVNDDSPTVPPVVPVVSVGNATVSPEGDSGTKPASFAVTLSQATTVPVTVAYATADGTATQPADYTAASGSLTFAPGETSKSVAVDVKGDLLEEPNETFALSLSNPAGATLGTAQGTGTIVDDDADAPSNEPPGGVDPNGLFCGRQHRGKCRGIKFKGEFDRPGNAVWSFAAYNANPGGSATAAASPIKLGKVARTIPRAGTFSVRFKLRGAKADRLRKRVKRAGFRDLRVSLAFTTPEGKRYVVVRSARLKR